MIRVWVVILMDIIIRHRLLVLEHFNRLLPKLLLDWLHVARDARITVLVNLMLPIEIILIMDLP